MVLDNKQIKDIKEVLIGSLRHKLQNYNPEPASMPFHTRLLGKDRLALFSFIHSLNTNFGTSIFEPVAIELAKNNFRSSKSNVNAGNYISGEAHFVIQKIMDNLATTVTSLNKKLEVEMIRKVCQKGEMRKVKLTQVDVMLESKNGELYLFDIKTAKPNAGGFKEYKRTLLEWVATILATNPDMKVNTLITIPYNPYEPRQYNRWTIRGMLDLKNELKVANEFWDFPGGECAYEDLLDCFEKVGIELREEIDEYFKKFINK